MGTRGLIFIRKKYHAENGSYYVYKGIYNHMDSYPTFLGMKLYLKMREYGIKEGLNRLNYNSEGIEEFEKYLLSGEFNGENETIYLTESVIDYLFHEWIYVIDKTGFEIWKSSNDEKRLYYVSWISIFHTPEEVKNRLLFSQMMGSALERITLRELPRR